MVVVLKFYNDDNQHGGYFVGVFKSLKKAEGVCTFGRSSKNNEEWYEYICTDINKEYIFDSPSAK